MAHREMGGHGRGESVRGALLIDWMITGNEVVSEKAGQRIIFAFVITNVLALNVFGEFGSLARVCFVLGGLVYAWIAIVLLVDLTKKVKVLMRADG